MSTTPEPPAAEGSTPPKAEAPRTELDLMMEDALGGELPKVLYHYTSQAGLLGITSTRKIWATNMAYLNDISEYDYGMNIIRAAVERRREQASNEDRGFFDEIANTFEAKAHNFLVTSLTQEEDLLSQWRGYTDNGNGFCIGFDAGALKARTQTGDTDMMLVRCVYEPARQQELAERLVDYEFTKWKKEHAQGDKSTIGSIWESFLGVSFDFYFAAIALAVSFKNAAFYQEREWRLVTYMDKANQARIRFRAGKSMVTPYTEVDLSSAKSTEPAVGLKSIIVGPCPFPDLAIASVRMLLEATGHEECDVRASTIPFRTW